jgi:hypothetical protein
VRPGAGPHAAGARVEEGLRLRDLRGERAVVARDLRLDHDHRAPGVKRSGARRQRAVAHAAQEVRLGLDRRRADGPVGQVQEGAHAAAAVGERHQRAAVHQAAGGAALGRERQPPAYELGRRLQQLDAHQRGERHRVANLLGGGHVAHCKLQSRGSTRRQTI